MKIKGQLPVFNDLIGACSSITTEVKLDLTESGISISAVDPSSVAMVFVDVPSSAFTEYDTEPGSIVIELAKIQEYINVGKKDVAVCLEIDEETHKLKVTVGGKAYRIGLIDPSAIKQPPKVPELQHDANICVNGADLVSSIKAAMKVTDHVVLEYDDKFVVSAVGDIDSLREEYKEESLVSATGTYARSLFSLDYLEDMGKMMVKTPQLNIALGTDYPAAFSFELNGMKIRYLLAPRIENPD